MATHPAEDRSDEAGKNEDSESSDEEENTIEPPVDKNLIEKGSEFLDELIVRLMNAPLKQDKAPRVSKSRRIKSPHKGHHFAHVASVNLEVKELEDLLVLAEKSFAEQSSLLQINADRLPIIICGDIHGQFRSLREIFRRCGSPFQRSYLFLGDYVDRGVQGLEVMTLLLALKVKLPNKVFLLRGNHECCDTCESYGFYDELVYRYNDMNGSVGESIERPAIVPPYGLATDLLWSDPDEDVEGWAMSSRLISLSFGPQQVEEFCKKFGFDLIVRAHQIFKEMYDTGYRFMCNGRLLTIFSAPNYGNCRNSGAVMKVAMNNSGQMNCRFIVFRVKRNNGSAESTR